MKIKCPQCSATNEVQKHCGNCGFQLLFEGVEIEEHAAYEAKTAPKRKNKWFLGIGVFLLVWIIGGAIFSILAAYARLNETYVPAIFFVLGLVVLWEIVRNKDDIEVEETTIK